MMQQWGSLAGGWTRRGWLRAVSGGVLGSTLGGWFGSLAAAMSQSPNSARRCILLWMNGGPSQTDTFDLKPGHENGGPFRPIATSVPGIEFSEHLPRIAEWAHQLAVIRSMSTKEGDHGRARDNMRTGYVPQASIQFPVLGSLLAKELGAPTSDLPNYVSIFSRGLFNAGSPPAGFLGPQFAPLLVGQQRDGEGTSLTVENLALPDGVPAERARARLELLRTMEREFLMKRPGEAAESHRTAYDRAERIMSPSVAEAFRLDSEPEEVQRNYGDSRFGQGCLLARRLVERGVPFTEVSLDGWDTHERNFPLVESLSGVLDQAWGALMSDLADRGLLESTLIVWMGEFGRTPAINPRAGRDHFPKAWSVVLGGGPIHGGQVIGRTSADGMEVEDRPVSTPDLLATICLALGVDPTKQNMSNVGRPIRLADPAAQPLADIVVSPPQ